MKTITGGAFQDSKGNAANGATITFVLLTPEVATNTGQVYPNTVSFTLDASGNLPGGAQIWANDELTPTGSVYRVTVVTSGGVVLYGPQNWSIVGTSPISVTNMTPVPVPAGLVVSNVAIEPAKTDATYYVSVNGNDSNDGLSWGTAKLTIQAAITAAGSGGIVRVAPGSYSTASSLTLQSNMTLFMAGVTLTYTGSSNAIVCQNVANAKIFGPLILLGQNTLGTVGLYLGSSAVNFGLTTECSFYDIAVGSPYSAGSSFAVGIRVDGNTNSGTYYNTFCRVSGNHCTSQGWLIKPTTAAHANSNRFIGCTALNNSGDGFQIDGSNFNTFVGPDAEGNGAYGFNQPGTMVTEGQAILGGDFESNTTADFNFGSSNVSNGFYAGFNSTSATSEVGFYANTSGGQWLPNGGPNILYNSQGSIYDFPIGGNSGTVNPLIWIRDVENSSANIFRVQRTGVGTGSFNIGTLGYPATLLSSTVEIISATPTGTGTQLGLGNTTGFGNGAAGTAVTTTLKGTGSGPTAPQTVVKYLEVDIGGTKFWLPLVQ